MKPIRTTIPDPSSSDPAFWTRLMSPAVSSSSPFPAVITITSPIPYAKPEVNPFEIERVLPLNAITPKAKFRTLPYYDRVAYLVAAGAMQGGTAIEATINFKTGETFRPLLRKLFRKLKATGWPGRHMWVEVKRYAETSKRTGKTKTTQHHVHLVLFNAGPGTLAFDAMQEFQTARSIEKARSCSIRVKSLAEIRSYIFKNKRWDRGTIGADKATLREAHAMAKLSALDLWKVWLAIAPVPPKGCEPLPEIPPILADRTAIEAATVDRRRKTQKARAKRAFDRDARKRARIAAGESGSVPAGGLPPAAAKALLESRQRDLESLAVGIPGEGAFDLIGAMEPTDQVTTTCSASGATHAPPS